MQHVLVGKDVLITAAATAGKTTTSLVAAKLMKKGDTRSHVQMMSQAMSSLVSSMEKRSNACTLDGQRVRVDWSGAVEQLVGICSHAFTLVHTCAQNERTQSCV